MAKKLTEKEIKEMILLAAYKNKALEAGSKKVSFKSFKEKTKLAYISFTRGHYMEIVMAWMLGYYRTVTKIYLRVEMSFKLDKQGCDFRFMKDRGDPFGTDVDMKFDKGPKDDDADLIKSHIVIRTYPVVPGKASNKKTMNGMQAVTAILQGAAFTPDELREQIFFSKSRKEELVSIINTLWREQTEKW